MKRLALLLLLLTGCAHAPQHLAATLAEPDAAATFAAAPANVTLQWTFPTLDRRKVVNDPWRAVCEPDTAPARCARIVAAKVTGWHPSATWRLHQMANADTFRVWWPACRAEAEPVTLWSAEYAESLAWRLPGTRAMVAALSASGGGENDAASGVICGSSAPEPILGQTPRMAGGAPLGLGQSHLAQAATPPLSAEAARDAYGLDEYETVTVRRDDLRTLLERQGGSTWFPQAPGWLLRIREAVGR